jgi:hypothetical protein
MADSGTQDQTAVPENQSNGHKDRIVVAKRNSGTSTAYSRPPGFVSGDNSCPARTSMKILQLTSEQRLVLYKQLKTSLLPYGIGSILF